MRKKQLTIMSVVMITSFITTFTGSALNLSVPAIGEEFNAGAVSLGWIINGYILASAALSVPFGRLADITSRKIVLVTGILIFTVCSGGASFAATIKALIIFRVAQGIGAAMIFSTNQAVLISAFSPEKRGKVLGFSIAATYTGLTAGPVVGGLLNHYFGWRSIFILTFGIGLIVFIIAAKKLPQAGIGDNGKNMDIIGSLLYVFTITSIMYGFSAYSTTNFAKLLIPLGVLFFILFVYHELRISSPIVQIRMFKNNIGYLLSNIAALLNYGATFALGYLLSIYLQIIKGYDSQLSGLILISQPLIMAILSPYAGKLSDRISAYKLASFGMALCSLGLFSFIFISENYPLPMVIVNLFVVGLGFAFFSSPNTNAVMSCVEPRDYSVASSVLATMRTIGHSASMA
ncbi:MAG: MFS transporter, partial [Eubacteriales bacterium]|nr:MFS transporter [Eubacteriales bacterium]